MPARRHLYATLALGYVTVCPMKKHDPTDPLQGLRATEARWQAVLDTAQDAIISIDASGIITLFNSAAERIFGYADDEVIGRNVGMLMPSPYREEHDGYVRSYQRTGEAKAIGRIRNVHGQRKSGEVFPIELSVGEAHVDAEVLYTAIIRDVSERQRTERELRESEKRFVTFMDHLPGVAFIKDIPGRYVYANRTFEELFHVKLDDIAGKTDDEMWPAETARQLKENDQHVLRDRAPIQTIAIIPYDDGPHEWLVTKFPIFDREGEPCMVGGVAVDITARRRAEARILDLEKAAQQRQRLADIGAITAQIVHDLGNPIAAISMQAQLIARRARREENETVLKAAEQIVSRVRYLDVMVREFLDFTREQRLTLRVLHLAPLLSEMVALWQPVAGQAVSIGLELPSQLPPIVADEEKLRRVFDNLIKNAVEAIDSGPGSITIRVSVPAADKVRISIEDSGPGLPQNLEVFRLFETTKPFGTGLGLPIVQQIVLAHGGGIEFASLQPHGTIFHIDLRCRGPAG